MCWKDCGSGYDKTFYWDEKDKDGWLNFKSEEVMKAEMAARGKLANVKSVIPPIDETRTPPKLEGDVEPLGYYIRRVNLGLTIKPQMNWLAVLRKVKTELKSVTGEEELAALEASLQFMLENCDMICNEVGEFTFGIDRDTGKAYLLDLARTEGQAGGGDQAENAKKGLKNLIALLK